MSKYDCKFFKVADTPDEFDIEKFKAGDTEQAKLYKDSKTIYHKTPVKIEDIIKEDSPNFAREVPEGCCFIDYDDIKKAKEIYEIIIHFKLRCLILETQHGYQFLFRKPPFYKKEMTGATNWFGYKFDTKGWTKGQIPPVQIIKVCGMLRKEMYSLDLDTPITTLDKIDIAELDILPYWLWGKAKNADLHKKGKTGDRDEPTHDDYTLEDNPFTQLMTMKDGSRHNHIVERCSYFGLSNGFEMEEFKSFITAIHDQYLVKIGTPMSDSDLFGDLPTRWDDYIGMLESNGYTYNKKERKWEKVKSKKSGKISRQEACEWLYSKYNFYVMGCNYDTGEGGQLCYITPDLRASFDLNIMWKELREFFYEQDFDTYFYKEVKEQLIQRCNEDKKYFRRSSKYYVCKNGIASCISDDIYDFDHFKGKNLAPTDLIYNWNLHDRKWVKEHEEDLGKNIKKFIKDLSRDSSGTPQPEVEQWLYVITGASIDPANSLGKIVVLSGGGQNGKSVFFGIDKMLLGQNFYNESNIFGSSPTKGYWGDGLDKGICCLVDELPQNYNKEAFSYIKGGVSRTGLVEINPKYGKKKALEILPQIMCATNHKFELFDKSYGMRRRVLILPCCYKVSDEEKDNLLLYRIVMNLDKNIESDKQIMKYRMNEETPNAGIVIEESGICIREQCVLDSLENGSLCWFANKCRYMYLDYKFKRIKLSKSEEMERLFDQTFGDDNKGQCKDFINWYLTKMCGGTDSIKFDLSPANCFSSELLPLYKYEYCKEKRVSPMEDTVFKNNCGRVIHSKYLVKKKKNDKGISYPFIYFDKPAKHPKK